MENQNNEQIQEQEIITLPPATKGFFEVANLPVVVKNTGTVKMFNVDVTNNKAVAILGNCNSGKTNLAIYLGRMAKKDKRYILGYPKEVEGYDNISDINDLNNVQDCVLVIDEICKFLKFYEKRSNEQLMDLLSTCEHKRVKLIFTTQITQSITKQVEALIPCYAICQINLHTLKNGSMPKYAIKSIKHPSITPFGINLEAGQFIWYDLYSREAGVNKIYKFPFQNIGKDWGLSPQETSDKNDDKNKMPTEIKIEVKQ